MTTSEVARQVFDEFDKSGDGQISKDELGAALKSLGQAPTEFELREMVRQYDKDFSGEIDFTEPQAMLATCERMKKATLPRFLLRAGLYHIVTHVAGDSSDDESDEESLSEDGNLAESEKKAGGCTPNIKVLALTAALFGAITAAQTVGAIMAGSKCLLADCVSMGVDACTYLGNIAVECQKGTKWYKPLELMVGGVSLAILTYFTFVVMAEALETILKPQEGGGEEVNGYIVLFFACLGILFDCASLYAFKKEAEGAGEAANMWTALLHVGADFLRSMTTFVSSILMLFFHVDTSAVDSYAAIILGITILGGAAFGIIELLKSADKASTIVGAVVGVVGFLCYLSAKAIV